MTIVAPPRALIFDWDNTLIDNWRAIHAALAATFEAMGHTPWTLSETRERVRESLRDSFPRLFGERWHAARDVFYETYERDHLDHIEVMPGAHESLAAFSDAGLYLGVVSNKNGDLLRREAAHLGWSELFGAIVGATDAPRDKPARDPVDMVLASGPYSAGPAVWFVGDAGIDMACARRAGCVPVLIGDPEADEFRDAPPDYAVPDLFALRALVQNT